jgi:cell division protein FtsW
MNNFLKKYLSGDVVIWFVFFALCVVSVIELYSASSQLAYGEESYISPVLRHAGFLVAGIVMAFGIHLIPVKIIRILGYLGLVVSIVLLLAVLMFGETNNEARRLLSVAGIKFQPSELAKLSLVIFAADMLSRIKNPARDEKPIFWWLMGISGMICALIFPENFSTAALLFSVVIILCIIEKISWRRLAMVLVPLTLVLVIGFAVLWNTPKDDLPNKVFDRAATWVSRFKNMNDPCEKLTDDNRQFCNGKIAIVRGGLVGVFPGNSVQRDYLSQAYSDFIFAIIIEEIGILGGIVVIVLYLVLLFRAGRIATRSTQVFPAMLAIGLSLIIVIQVFFHLSVITGLGPVTGQPLPLISRGGTSITITCIYFGIILGVTRQMKKEEQRDSNLIAQTDENIEEVKLDEL